MTAISQLLVPFKESLIIGVRGGQRLRCPVSTLQRLRSDARPSSGAFPVYRYANRVTGEVVESARVDFLVERWMGDLDLSTQINLKMRRNLDAAVEEEGGGDGEQ